MSYKRYLEFSKIPDNFEKDGTFYPCFIFSNVDAYVLPHKNGCYFLIKERV